MQSKDVMFCIVVHSPQIIKKFEKDNKYNCLPSYIYVLVGKHDINYTSEKIIQCDILPDNIEHCNNYLAYTGWYAISKNIHLIPENVKYLFFLEYDTNIINDKDIDSVIKNILLENKDAYGTDCYPTTSCFLDNSIYNFLMVNFLIEQNIPGLPAKNKNWMVTNNTVLKRDFLIELFNSNFTKKFLKFLDNHKLSGHSLERFLSVYCFLYKKQFGFISPNCFKHHALDSHNTQGRHNDYERFKTLNQISDEK
jgi:hypothetical protein